jgi:hypothetical protein
LKPNGGNALRVILQVFTRILSLCLERVTEIVEADEIADSIEEISQLRQWLLVDHFDLENINCSDLQY